MNTMKFTAPTPLVLGLVLILQATSCMSRRNLEKASRRFVQPMEVIYDPIEDNTKTGNQKKVYLDITAEDFLPLQDQCTVVKRVVVPLIVLSVWDYQYRLIMGE